MFPNYKVDFLPKPLRCSNGTRSPYLLVGLVYPLAHCDWMVSTPPERSNDSKPGLSVGTL